MALETGETRSKRRRQRTLFDGVAELCQASRRRYPPEIVTFAIETARLRPGSKALAVGCGTGQLTGQLAAHGFTLTAIDIGPAMTQETSLVMAPVLPGRDSDPGSRARHSADRA